MSCERCDGSGWLIVRVGENEGAAPCPECRRTARPVEPRTPLTLPEATGLVDTLCDALSFAPTTPAARGVITSLVMEMCETTEQLVYVVKRTLSLHTKWDTCGVPGLRQILCSKYRPKDGYVITATESYPDGIPAEHPRLEPEPLKLPAGRMSASPELDTVVHQLANHVDPAAKNARPTQADLEAIKEQAATEFCQDGIPPDHPRPEPIELAPGSANARPKLDTVVRELASHVGPTEKKARPTQADIEAIKEQQRQNQERRKAIDSSSCKVIADTARHGRDVTTQPGNGPERATRAFLRLMRRWAGLGRLSYPSS